MKFLKIAAIAGAAGVIIVVALSLYQLSNKKPYALEIDATKDTTDISGTMYRVRLTNVGSHELTGLVVTLGPGDVQTKSSLDPGQTFFFYPGENTQIEAVKVVTNEGINATQDYRSPLKTFGLPGSGR